MGAYVSGEKSFVKPDFTSPATTAAFVNNPLLFATLFGEIHVAGLPFLPHHLKRSFTFPHKVNS
ncbi:DUF5951 family protein [Pluralibacter gergoviae]|uniref:DUF5951 family protein n=1 Tax=Pluralibacter gergoviae TaxID=61647 RepID=UPI001D10E01B